MGMTAGEYRIQLQALLPAGTAWPRDADAELTHTLEALAEELARIDVRSEDLVEEADPRTSFELLPDWERIAALPAVYVTGPQTTEERRQALVAKLTLLGGQDPGFFIDLAAGLGITITVMEFRPARVGKSAIGAPCYTARVRFCWQINHPDILETRTKIGARIGARINYWQGPVQVFYIGRFAPGHNKVLFGNGTRRI